MGKNTIKTDGKRNNLNLDQAVLEEGKQWLLADGTKVHLKKSSQLQKVFEGNTQVQLQALYIDYWLFCYTSRNVRKKLNLDGTLSLKVDDLFRVLMEMYDNCNVSTTLGSSACDVTTYQILEFTNSLVYGYYRHTYPDSPPMDEYDLLLNKYNHPFHRLNSDEFTFVEILYKATIKHGFLAPMLYLKPNTDGLWNTFVASDSVASLGFQVPRHFPYPKKGHNLKGVQVSLDINNENISNEWDLVVYYNVTDTVSTVAQAVRDNWAPKERKAIGNRDGYFLALYVDCKATTPSHVNKVLAAQLQLAEEPYLDSELRFIGPLKIKYTLTQQPIKQRRIFEKKTSEALSRSLGLTSKTWGLEENNLRRAISLYHWDKMQDSWSGSRKQLIRQTIEKLKKNHPSLLKTFYKKYFEKSSDDERSVATFGDSASVEDTIIREMEYDFDMTRRCIEQAEYLSRNQVKDGKYT